MLLRRQRLRLREVLPDARKKGMISADTILNIFRHMSVKSGMAEPGIMPDFTVRRVIGGR
jgi:hypothetical protein